MQQIAAAGMQRYPRWLVYMKKNQKLSRAPEFQLILTLPEDKSLEKGRAREIKTKKTKPPILDKFTLTRHSYVQT